MIPLSVPHISGNAWKYLKECLDTEWVSSAGVFVDRFEKETAAFTGAGRAVACVNGTAALHAALRIVGIQPDDEVIVPTLTFIAPVNAVRYCGAAPLFMDCDVHYNLDPEKTVDFIRKETEFRAGSSWNRLTGRRIRAVLPVHVFGHAADLTSIAEICRERGIRIVEDATESLGTRYVSGPLAGIHTGLVGDIGCLSFNGNKIITTGGGGMIITNDAALAERAAYLTTQAKDDEVLYIHDEVGYNYRLSNIQAALGVSQLELLPSFLERKKEHFRVYSREIDAVPGLRIAEGPDYADNNRWMTALQIEVRKYGKTRDELRALLANRNIQSRPVWQLNHLQKPYLDCQAYRIEKAPDLLARTLNIPCSVGLSSEDREKVIRTLRISPA